MSLGFQAPTSERLAQLGAGDRFKVLGTAVDRLEQTPEHRSLRRAVAQLAVIGPPSTGEAAGSFVRLFGHTARGPVCACETEYGPDNGYHQPQQLADVAGYY